MTENHPFPPQHMDKYSRNERLYHFLLGMGLIVNPICLPDDPAKIDYLHVTVTLANATESFVREVTESPSISCVVKPIERPEIRNVVGSSEATGDTVINFPTVDR
jgi:hypothetical protein